MEHTKGPWETIKSVKDRRLNIIQARGGMTDLYQIAKVKSALDCDQEISNANARLIATAPDLLELLKETALYLEMSTAIYHAGGKQRKPSLEFRQRIDRTIEKATE